MGTESHRSLSCRGPDCPTNAAASWADALTWANECPELPAIVAAAARLRAASDCLTNGFALMVGNETDRALGCAPVVPPCGPPDESNVADANDISKAKWRSRDKPRLPASLATPLQMHTRDANLHVVRALWGGEATVSIRGSGMVSGVWSGRTGQTDAAPWGGIGHRLGPGRQVAAPRRRSVIRRSAPSN